MAVPSSVRTVTDVWAALGADSVRVKVAVAVPLVGRTRLIQLTDTVGVSGAVPVPVRLRVWGPSPSLPVITQLSARAPWAVGVKDTVMGSAEPAAMTVPTGSGVAAVKPAPAVGGAEAVMVMGAPLVLRTEKACVSVTPAGTDPNDRLEGDRASATPGVTVKVAAAVVAVPSALVNTASNAVPLWDRRGVRV